MASAYDAIAIITILIVLQPMTCRGGALSPFLSPFVDEVCKKVECGKGTCKPSSNSTFLFECVCDLGWKQTRPDNDDQLSFLPCVIPNCTLNYSCIEAAPPVQDKESRANESSFDPCHWTDCGGGTCNRTSQFTHSCLCSEGYDNLLNVTAFPCFRECALGIDCSTLGITVTNKSTSSVTSSADSSKNQATSVTLRDINWLIIVATSLALVLWR